MLGAVDGASLTSDAYDIVGGDRGNQARTIGLALRSAGLVARDVGLVHAHATSTPVGDLNEADALRAVSGTPRPVTSTKGETGHLLGASGALSALVALLALHHGVVPPTLNQIQRGPTRRRRARPAVIHDGRRSRARGLRGCPRGKARRRGAPAGLAMDALTRLPHDGPPAHGNSPSRAALPGGSRRPQYTGTDQAD